MFKILRKLLFRIAKSPASGYLVGFSFQNLTYLIPVKKIIQSNLALLCLHPKPFYEEHLLIVPLKQIKDLPDLLKSQKRKYFLEIFRIASQYLTQNRKKISDKLLMINYGCRQEVKQVHFHLIKKIYSPFSEKIHKNVFRKYATFELYRTNSVKYERIGFLFRKNMKFEYLCTESENTKTFIDELKSFIDNYCVIKNGFTLYFSEDISGNLLAAMELEN